THLVVRLPLHVIATVKFPIKGAEIDLANAAPAIKQALQGVAAGIVLSENGRPLTPSRSVGRLSLPSDRSFELFDRAVAWVASAPAEGTTIYGSQGYFDAHLTYPIASPGSRFAIQSTVAPELKDYLKVAIRYLPFDEAERTMVITSRSGEVPLNPA